MDKKAMRQNPDPTDTDEAALSGSLDEMVLQYSEEYDNLSSTMDEIDSCLDSLEQRNDDLYSKLQQLLESSRQARRELEEGGASSSRKEDPLTDKGHDIVSAAASHRDGEDAESPSVSLLAEDANQVQGTEGTSHKNQNS